MEHKNYYLCVLTDGIYTMLNAREIAVHDGISLETRKDCDYITCAYKCEPFADADTGNITVLAKETTVIDGHEMLTGVEYVTANNGYHWISVKPVKAQRTY